MTVALDALYLAQVFYYTTVFYLRSRFAPYIPSAKAGGFTALFCKKLILKPTCIRCGETEFRQTDLT